MSVDFSIHKVDLVDTVSRKIRASLKSDLILVKSLWFKSWFSAEDALFSRRTGSSCLRMTSSQSRPVIGWSRPADLAPHLQQGNSAETTKHRVWQQAQNQTTFYWICLVFNLRFLTMFVTDIRKEFYDVVANQVSGFKLITRDVSEWADSCPVATYHCESISKYLWTKHELWCVSSPQRVALLVAADIDALCACKILQVRY